MKFYSDRFSRFTQLKDIGKDGFDKISKSRIGIFGMGGLGSWSSLLLTQLNIGYLRIVDRDVVELSNIPRTPIYNLDSVDLPKVEEAKKFLSKINNEITIEAIATNIDEFTIDSLVKDLDLVIDGLDTFSTRYIVNKACFQHKIPFVFAGAVGMTCNLSTLTYTDETPCLFCFFRDINDVDMPTCDITGVHTSILSLAASIQVAEAVKLLVSGQPTLISRLAFFDLNTYDLDIITLKKNDFCNVCGKSKENLTKPSSALKILELCGNESFSMAPIPRKSLNINEITNKLKIDNEISIKKSGNLGVTFTFNNFDITIFKGGNILLRKVQTKEEAKVLFDQFINKFMQ